MYPDREEAIMAICRRSNTAPHFCEWIKPEAAALKVEIEALMAEVAPGARSGRPFGPAEEAFTSKALKTICAMGDTAVVKTLAADARADLRAVMAVVQKHIDIMTDSEGRYQRVPKLDTDRDMALYVLALEGIQS